MPLSHGVTARARLALAQWLRGRFNGRFAHMEGEEP